MKGAMCRRRIDQNEDLFVSGFLRGLLRRRPDAVALPVEQGTEVVGDGADVFFRHLVACRDTEESA